jgi:hypothetical protein
VKAPTAMVTINKMTKKTGGGAAKEMGSLKPLKLLDKKQHKFQ